MTDLLDLAARVEAAEGPDKVLDGMIEAALQLNAPGSLINYTGPLEYEADDEDGSVSVWSDKRKVKRYRAPVYTASLDAAMTLVPEGCVWSVSCDDERPGEFRGTVMPNRGTFTLYAATPALALCAAALRARATLLKGGERD